jgi:phage protein D
VSIGRAPRCQLVINGQKVAPIECNVHVSIHQSADTFYAKLPLLPSLGLDAAFWANTAPIPIEVDGVNDFNSASFSPLLIGQVDRPQLILHESAVMLRGRDKTAALTDTKTTQLWVNQTDQQIISSLAQQAGLAVQFGADAIKAGLDLDADYYQEHSDQDAPWNVIVALARKAGCIAFVKGTTLYVQPIDAAPPNGNYLINWYLASLYQLPSSMAVMLSAAHNLTLAKQTTLTLQSWQHQQGQAVTSSYQSKPANANADRTIYTRRAANLTKEQQDRIALAHLKETLTHEREIDISNYPGDVAVIPGLMGLKLTGTGTQFDQTYVLSDALHRFSNDGGYTMDLTAHSQDASRGEPTQLQ